MANRQTVAVSELVGRVNAMIASTSDEMKESRITLTVLLTNVLMATGNYRGFAYLPSETTESGELREGYDNTRVRFSAPAGREVHTA